MSLSISKPVSCRIYPAVGADASLSKLSKLTMMKMNRQVHPPLQVKGKEKTMLEERSSRREMLQHLTAATVGLLSLQFPASAEAASVGEMIMQKLEELQQKFGLSKPKDDGAAKPKVENGATEENPKAKDESAAKPMVENSAKEASPKAKDESAGKPKVENSAKEASPKAKDESAGKRKVENSAKEASPKAEDESAGKPKVENGAKEASPKPKDESASKPKVENSVKEKKLTSTAQEALVPAPPGIINGGKS